MDDLTEDQFKKLENPSADIHLNEGNEKLLEAYKNIIDILKKYCDWKEEYYPIVAIWIIGTYFHDKMITYPYLYFNASKESGKSRSVRLITYLAKDGEMVNSMTEAVLFRTTGTLGIDEFERASRKGSENFMELLNSAYKKGVKVKRMKTQRAKDGSEERVVENFEVFRPIVLANIWGMDQVLEDRCLPLYLEKTTSQIIGDLIEIWDHEKITTDTLALLRSECSLCNVVTLRNVYSEWNEYITTNYITTGTNNYIKLHLFEKIRETGIKRRMLELSFPLLIVADMIGEEIVDTLAKSLKLIAIEKDHEAFLENKDIIFVDFVSQQPLPNYRKSIKVITEEFRQFTQTTEDWLNEKWVGRAIKRLSLSISKKRTEKGIEVVLDVEKAQEKIKMFGEKNE